MREQTASVGFSLPIVLSFPSGRRVSTTRPDLRYRPYGALFIEPGFSVNQLWANPAERGTMPHFSMGASMLEIGPGFGVTAVMRKSSPTIAHRLAQWRFRITTADRLIPVR